MNLRHAALAFGLFVTIAACAAPSGSGPATSPAGSVPDVTASDEPTASAGASPVAGGGVCDPTSLYAEVISWTSGAGHRVATVQLTNIGAASCKVRNLAKPQLVGGDGAVLIDGKAPSSTKVLTLNPNDVVSTMVQDGNYCGSTPVAPVSVAFVFPSGEGRVIADAVSPDDVNGLPPCSGSGPGDIEMQPFAP